jgi:hypothetical protein
MKDTVKSSLQIESEALGERYLGLPTVVGKVADGTFDYSADRIRSFVHGWGVNNMSCGGREVLLKANAQVVPTYPMSCFKLLAPLCKKATYPVQTPPLVQTLQTPIWATRSPSNAHRERWAD